MVEKQVHNRSQMQEEEKKTVKGPKVIENPQFS